MTLPTGVSTYLLQCLDVESTADYNPGASSSPSSFSSPEIFRDEGSEQFNFYSEEFGKYKNSTLLDTSKAVAIDKIPQISNLSAILAVNSFFSSSLRQKPSNFNFTSSALNVSTTVAGKKACKITAARERTPDLESDMCCSSPLGLARKPDNQTAKSKRLLPKEKGKKSNTLEEETSSVRQPDASGRASAGSRELAAEVLPSQQAGAVGPLCARRQICCIVGTSPRRRAPRPRQVPVSTREFWLAKGVPEGSRT
ncbi:MEIKN protein, partial [Alcedo cyanopectus]|nr:MEIKN protein [Ceyx cyanopectus]